MRRAWIIKDGFETKNQFGNTGRLMVEESSKEDQILLYACGIEIPLTKAEWKELCDLQYQTHFVTPPRPQPVELPCPVCDGVEPGGHGEEPCL